MSAVRSVLCWTVFGALAGTWAGGLIGRLFLPWYNTPNAGIMSQCACRPLAESTASLMLTYQLGAMAVGAVVFGVVALVLGAGRKRKVEPPAPGTPPPAAAA